MLDFVGGAGEDRFVALLRRVLYLQALVWSAIGLALALAPRFVLVTILGQTEYPEYAWVRLGGVMSFTLALLMVMVAHRSEELWWWSWAFALMAAATAVVVTLNAAFGLPTGASAWMWWAFSAIAWAFAIALAWGLGRAGLERPPT
jgi:hypothetical protein